MARRGRPPPPEGRITQAYRLHVEHGLSYAEIGRALGVSKSTAYRAVKIAFATIPITERETARRVVEERIHYMWRAAAKELKDGKKNTQIQAVFAMLQVNAQLAKLYGVNEPPPTIRIEHTDNPFAEDDVAREEAARVADEILREAVEDD